MTVRFRLFVPNRPTRYYIEEGEAPTVADAVRDAREVVQERASRPYASVACLGRIRLEVVDEEGKVLADTRLVL